MIDDDKTKSTESFADLFQQAGESRKGRLTRGQKIDAKVIGITGEYIFLDVGGKSEGYLAKSELVDAEGNLLVAVGDTIKAYFLSSDKGEKLFTTRLGGGSVSTAHLQTAFNQGVPIEGQVEKEIKGGFEIKLAGNVRAFCPFSQMGLYRVENTDEYIGQKYSFMIMELTEKGRNIIISRRALLEQERLQQKEELRESLREGMAVRGRVTSVRDFGAFVDIGGVDGLIPISEIGWSRVENINDFLQVGQEVEVIILSLDWVRERIGLSLKQALADPWSTVLEKYTPQSNHHGTVSRLEKFGAFVTLEPGVDGLLHISKLGGGRKLNHPKEAVVTGQSLEVRIESVDQDKKRISLDLAANQTAEEGEAQEEEYAALTQQKTDKGGGALGTFGDLLQGKLKQKKR